MSGFEQLSREDLLALVEKQARLIEQLIARIAAQDERIAELERQLSRNSRNSSQPPSTLGSAAGV